LKVTLLARTGFIGIPESVEGTPFGEFFYSDRNALINDSDTLSHFAGRSCYQAWKMEHEKTASNMGYLENILNQGHESVLEHGSATFYIEGVSRNLTHELIRHRHLSYSELSQRFINMEEAQVVVPPALGESFRDMSNDKRRPVLFDLPKQTRELYNEFFERLTKEGKSRKQAREAARSVLPGGTETRIVVSGNHRAWRDMLKKRYSTHADAEICELAGLLLESLRELAPGIYQDFPSEPFA
jgi:thymidylate synthase (FAD)